MVRQYYDKEYDSYYLLFYLTIVISSLSNIGINRKNEDNISITLPIFHAFGIESEMDGKGKQSQKDLLSKQINKKEYKDLNGKKIEDVLWIGDVAALITCIKNMLVSTNVQQIVFSGTNETLLVTILTISLSCDETYRMRKVIKSLGSQMIRGNGQSFLRKVAILKQLHIMKRC